MFDFHSSMFKKIEIYYILFNDIARNSENIKKKKLCLGILYIRTPWRSGLRFSYADMHHICLYAVPCYKDVFSFLIK